MICPNLSIPDIKAEFDELKSVVGEDMAYLIWDRNNGYHLDKASNGKPSKLFNDLLGLTDRKTALDIKAKTLSNAFKLWFGDSKVVDENGEPLVKNNTFSNELESKLILNSGVFNRHSDNIYDNEIANKEINHQQTSINGSMAEEIVLRFENYFPDYSYFNDEQRRIVANLVEEGKIQLSCTI